MADPVYVQSANSRPGGSGGSIGVAFLSSVKVGNVIVVFALGANVSLASAKLNTCADTLGNTYTIMDAGWDSGDVVSLSGFSCPVTVAGTPTVTVTFNGDSGGNRSIVVAEYTRVGVPNIDSYSFLQSQGSSVAGVNNNRTVVTVAANTLVLSVIAQTGLTVATISEGAGFQMRDNQSGGQAIIGYEEGMRRQSGSFTPTYISSGTISDRLSASLALTSGSAASDTPFPPLGRGATW